jgi:CheY-like chemotaxis protein
VLISATETDLNYVMDELYSFHSIEAKSKGLSLSVKPSLSTEQATVITDSSKLHGILTNLIKNAIKYSEEGSIEFGYSLKKTNELAELEFYVKDTGIGIPKDRQEAIFERFIQADIGDTRAFEGSGLGLSISKAYVEMLGGKIRVESKEGIGSTFYFTLPYVTEIMKEKLTKEEVPTSHKETLTTKLKILIAEDEETSEEYITTIVQDFGKEIINVQNGKDAVEACHNNQDIDLVLMDIRMPEMDGYEATRQIRKFNKDVIIIAQTAYALSGDKEKAIEAGCNDYITKPVKKEELIKKIQKILG